MKSFSRLIPLLLACVVASPLASAQPTMLLSGNDKALWLVRVHPKTGGFDIVAKPANEKWKWVVPEELQGLPATAVALDDNLHIMLTRPTSYLIFDLQGDSQQGLSPNDPNWPRETAPLALCQAASFAGSSVGTFVAIVARTGQVPASQPASAPAGRVATMGSIEVPVLVPAPRPAALSAPAPAPEAAGLAASQAASRPSTAPAPAEAASLPLPAWSTSQRAASLTSLAIFQSVPPKWNYVAQLDGVLLTSQTTVTAAVVDETLYLAISSPTANRLVAWKAGQWQDLPLAGTPARGLVVATLNVKNRLVLVVLAHPAAAAASQPQAMDLHICARTPAESTFSDQVVGRNGSPLTWDAAKPPLVAGVADQIALVWRQDKAMKFATCNVSGELAVYDMDILNRRPSTGDGLAVIQYFMWALLGSIFITMFLLRPSSLPKPFSLPPTLQPAAVAKRFAAGLIDLFPFLMLSGVGFALTTPATTPEDLQGLFQMLTVEHTLPANMAYCMVISVSLYLFYCAILEQVLGATLGKRIFRLRVVGDDGVRPGLREIALRNLLTVFVLVWLPVLLLIPLFTRYRQGLGDMVSRTTVVEPSPNPAPPPPPPPDEHANSPWG